MSNAQTLKIDKIAIGGITLAALLSIMLLATGGAAAADDTTVIEGVNNTTVENASEFNVTYDTSELNSSSTLVESHDSANRTAVVAVEIGTTTLNKSIDYGDQTEYTVDYATETNYPADLTNDSINVTVDQSASELVIDGSTIYPEEPLGSGGSGSNQKMLIAAALILVAILLKD